MKMTALFLLARQSIKDEICIDGSVLMMVECGMIVLQ